VHGIDVGYAGCAEAGCELAKSSTVSTGAAHTVPFPKSRLVVLGVFSFIDFFSFLVGNLNSNLKIILKSVALYCGLQEASTVPFLR
jgi:hypothetical protein